MYQLQMVAMPEFRAIHHYREAVLEGQVNYAVVQTGPSRELVQRINTSRKAKTNER